MVWQVGQFTLGLVRSRVVWRFDSSMKLSSWLTSRGRLIYSRESSGKICHFNAALTAPHPVRRNHSDRSGFMDVTIADRVAWTAGWSRTVSEPESDLDLVKRVKKDPPAFGLVYERYVTRIYNYVYYRVGNHHEAEDLTSRVFQRALTHIKDYSDRGVPFSAWLYRIAHNLVANWHRDHARRQDLALEDVTLVGEAIEMPEWVAETNEQRRWLLAAIRHLPEERQELLILKFVEQLSNAEVGQIMGRTEGAIKSLYHRTLIALRDDLIQGAAASSNPSSEAASAGDEIER